MIAPPRTAERLLDALGADRSLADAVIGDLAEEFALRVERDGVRAARRWYYREAIRSAPHLLRNWSRGLRVRDVAHLGGVVLSSYVFMLMLGLFAVASLHSVIVALGYSPDFQAASWSDLRLLWLELAVAPLSSMTGGYIAAWLNRRAPLVSALALGVVWSCGGPALAAAIRRLPIWYPVALAVVVILGTTAGGALRVRTASSFRGARLER